MGNCQVDVGVSAALRCDAEEQPPLILEAATDDNIFLAESRAGKDIVDSAFLGEEVLEKAGLDEHTDQIKPEGPYLEATDGAEDRSEHEPEPEAEVQPLPSAGLATHLVQVRDHNGFFVAFDVIGHSGPQTASSMLKAYGVTEQLYKGEAETIAKLQEMQMRLSACECFEKNNILGVVLSRAAVLQELHGISWPRYLWTQKKVVPFLRIDQGLGPTKDGVRLMKDLPADQLDAILEEAITNGVKGTRTRAFIKAPIEEGIRAVVEQQLSIARHISARGLLPMLSIEVGNTATEKAKCEHMLSEILYKGLDNLGEDVVVVLDFSIPSKANTYILLTEHTNVLRVAATSNGYALGESCKKLSQNLGMVGCVGAAFCEGIKVDQTDKELEQALENNCAAIFKASRKSTTSEEQVIRIHVQDGFFVALDHGINDAPKILREYGLDETSLDSEAISHEMHNFRMRVMTNQHFNSSRVIGVTLNKDSMQREIQGLPAVRYVWEKKKVVPFMRLDDGLQKEKNGVQLMKVAQGEKLDELLHTAAVQGVFGIKMHACIRLPNQVGINSVVEQQFALAKKVFGKGLVPMLSIEVDKSSPKKAECERSLFGELMQGLGDLHRKERLMFEFSMPNVPNTYLPLVDHPNTLRVSATSGGEGRSEACKKLALNVGVVAGFGRAFLEGIKVNQSEQQYERVLQKAMEEIHQASFATPTKETQTIKVHCADGFMVALDQTGDAAREIMQKYGYEFSSCTPEAEVSVRLHEQRTRILANPKFHGSRVIGCVVSEQTMTRKIQGMPSARYLWEQKQVVPFLKIDRGVEPEQNGVQLLKSILHLDQLLDKANSFGIFGTKARSVIRLANATGIQKVVDQQFEIGRRAMAKGLVPILMMDVDINSPQKDDCETILLQALLGSLSKLRSNEKIVLWLTLPNKPNLFLPLMAFPNTIRVVALSGGYSKEECCARLFDNVNMIAGFSRAFTEGLSISQPDELFTTTLDGTCRDLFRVSRTASAREEQIAKVKYQHGFFVPFDHALSVCRTILNQYEGTESMPMNRTQSVGAGSNRSASRRQSTLTMSEVASLRANLNESATASPKTRNSAWDSGDSRPKISRRNSKKRTSTSLSLPEVQEKIHEMRARFITNARFNGARVIGIIMDRDTWERDIEYMPSVKYLWEQKKVVSILNISNGARKERDGVQLMEDIPRFDELLDRAANSGVLGIKTTAIIKAANSRGIRNLVRQQFEIARQVLSRGLLPVIQCDMEPGISDKADCERILRQAMFGGLRILEPSHNICLVLPLPENQNVYSSLVGHPQILRVAALSSGYDQEKACRLLELNRGVIACFDQALTEGTSSSQTDHEFTQALDKACETIFNASLAGPCDEEETRSNAEQSDYEESRSNAEQSDYASEANECGSSKQGASRKTMFGGWEVGSPKTPRKK